MKIDVDKSSLMGILILSILIALLGANSFSLNGYIYNVINNIEEVRVNYSLEDYKKTESEHFIYRYKDHDEENIEMIKDISENTYDILSDFFNIEIIKKPSIIVFPNLSSMNTYLKLPNSQRAMGVYYGGFISILSPSSTDYKVNKESFFRNGPLVHELTHLFVDKKTKGNYPEWFTEGTALYFEKQLTGFEWENGQREYPIDELVKDFDKLETNSAYKSSYNEISKFIQKHGFGAFMDMMERLGKGYSLEYFGI